MTQEPSWRQIEESKHKSIEELSAPDVKEALERIGYMPEGKTLETFLMKVMTRVGPLGSDVGALSDFEGQRRLARLLLNLLNGIGHDKRDDRDGRDRSGNGGDAD